MFDAWTDSLSENSRESAVPELKSVILLKTTGSFSWFSCSFLHSWIWSMVNTAYLMAICWHLFSMNLFGIQYRRMGSLQCSGQWRIWLNLLTTHGDLDMLLKELTTCPGDPDIVTIYSDIMLLKWRCVWEWRDLVGCFFVMWLKKCSTDTKIRRSKVHVLQK